MSTQMRIAKLAEGWAVLNGESPVAINKQVHYDDRDELVDLVQGRGLFVWFDGEISKEPEPVLAEAVPAQVEQTAVEAKPRRPRAKKEPDAPRFTEDQKAARAEYAKKYRSQMSEEQKERARERARERQKRWRDQHPDEAAKYAKLSSRRRKERYNEDPAFRAEYREKQRAYAKAKDDDE